MGGVVSAGATNEELVDNLKTSRYIRTPEIEEVFRKIDRLDFFPGEYAEEAWKDMACKYDDIHLSAPCIYCEVMEHLDLRPNISFLNVGFGTGYLSTLVGSFLGPHATNHGVDTQKKCMNFSTDRIQEYMRFHEHFDPSKFCQPELVLGNGCHLNPNYRKYDRVYVGAQVDSHLEAYFKSLVKVGGILIMPIRDSLQKYTHASENEWESCTILNVTFASLIEHDPLFPSDVALEIPSQPKTLQQLARIIVRTSTPVEDIDRLPVHRSLHRFLRYGRSTDQQRPKRPFKTKKQDENLSNEVILFRRLVHNGPLVFEDDDDSSDGEHTDEDELLGFGMDGLNAVKGIEIDEHYVESVSEDEVDDAVADNEREDGSREGGSEESQEVMMIRMLSDDEED